MREHETREFKRSLSQLKEGIISLCAMLNKHGRCELWFGIEPSGEAVGLEIGEKTPRDVSEAIAVHIEPKIYPAITSEIIDGKSCLKIICDGNDVPYYAYGRAYMRVADADRQLSPSELESLILCKHHEAMIWDKRPSMYSCDDLDERKVKDFITRAGLEWDSIENALSKLDCLKDNKAVNATMLFFGKRPTVKLRCAVFATDSTSTILDQHDYEGDILYLIEEAQKYILKNIHIGMKLDGLYRIDVPEISHPAFREAIINAFCHRDYRDPDEVRVAIFKDRVEIRNPGSLYGGLTVEDLLRKEHISKRRNPLVADLLRRIHMVEGWGRGMPLIMENEPSVEFREIAQVFMTVFKRKSFQTFDSLSSGADDHATIKTTIKTTTKTTIKNFPDPINLSSSTRKILARIVANPELSLEELATLFGLTRDGIYYHIKKLRKMGVLSREGKKGGKWIVHLD